MLLELTIGNFKSIKKNVTLSMVASTLKEHKNTHTFNTSKYSLLKSALIFGANASGKSNLVKGISFMKNFVISSAKDTQINEKIDIDNFKLDIESELQPSFFEVIFLLNNTRYRYGFQVNEDRVDSEWLFFVPTIKEAKLFTREGNNISLGVNFKEGRGLKEKTRNNALFLSVAAQFNGEISRSILNWFRQLNGKMPVAIE